MENEGKPKEVLTNIGKTGRIVQVRVEQIKTAYIVEGLNAQDLAKRFQLPTHMIETFIQENQLELVRSTHVKHGLEKLQSVQLAHAEKLMTMETQFKKMRIVQLEKTLEDYLAYYSKYGHFYKVHPLTGAVLNDTNGLPIQIKLPNVSVELAQLKEAVTLSEGLKSILGRIDEIINKPKDTIKSDPDTIDMANFDNLFKQKSGDDD